MKLIPWILLIVGAVAAWLLWPETDTSDREKELKSHNIELQLRIDSLADINKAILIDVKEDSIRGVKIQDSLKTRLNAKLAEVARLKADPVVIKVRDQVPEVGNLIDAQDSVIVLGEQRIAAYEHQLSKLQVNLVGITANFESMLSAERQRFANSQEIIALKDKELKKEKRGKLVAKILIPVAAAVGLFLGSNL